MPLTPSPPDDWSTVPHSKVAFASRLLLEGSRRRLQVDDDGVGMSSQTLSRDLLDFGKSFWASERASSEFPGIHAAKLTPIGRFGIGFFFDLHGSRRGKSFLQAIRQCP